jgi:hypothetical protein
MPGYRACFAGDNPHRLMYVYASGRREKVEAMLPTHGVRVWYIGSAVYHFLGGYHGLSE